MQSVNTRRTWACRVKPQTIDFLDRLALQNGYCRLDGELRLKGDAGQLLDALAAGSVSISKQA